MGNLRINQKNGFTLVELLVVISIIALLLAVLIPSLNKAKEVASRIICGNHLKDFGTANVTYTSTCNGYFLPMAFLDPNINGSVAMGAPVVNYYDQIMWLQNKLFRSYVSYDTYPKDKKNPNNSAGYKGALNMPKALLCPSDKISIDWKNQRDNVLVSYGYNLTDWDYNWDGPLQIAFMGYHVGQVKQPAAKLTFTDSIDWWITWGQRGADYAYGWDKHRQMNIADYRNPNYGTCCYGPVIYRHSEGCDVAFYDGHVKYMKKQEVFVRLDYYDAGGSMRPRAERKPGIWSVDFKAYARRTGAF